MNKRLLIFLMISFLSLKSFSSEVCSLENSFKDYEDIKNKLEEAYGVKELDRRCSFTSKSGATYTMDIISRENKAPHVFLKIEKDGQTKVREYRWDEKETLTHVKFDDIKETLKKWDDKVYQVILYDENYQPYLDIRFDQKKDCISQYILAYTTESFSEKLQSISDLIKDSYELAKMIWNEPEVQDDMLENAPLPPATPPAHSAPPSRSPEIRQCWSKWLNTWVPLCQGRDSICIKVPEGYLLVSKNNPQVEEQCGKK